MFDMLFDALDHMEPQVLDHRGHLVGRQGPVHFRLDDRESIEAT